MLLRINTQTAMTKHTWEKAPFPMRHGHNRGNTVLRLFPKGHKIKVAGDFLLLRAVVVPWREITVAF